MRNPRFILGLTLGLAVVSFLISLPRIPISYNNDKYKFLNLDSYVGGYYISAFGGRIRLDLREFKKGLDIKGGVRVALKADTDKIAESDKDSALESAKEVITRRVDILGVSESLIQTSKVGGDYRIIVELPGVTDVNEALETIGKTAQLSFKKIKSDVEYDESKLSEYFLDKNVWEDSGVSGADLKGADVVFSQGQTSANSAPEIRLRFTNEGREKFSELAKGNINKPIGIFLDEGEQPVSMPVVSPDLASGLTSDPVITGNFTVQDANRLSISIRAGALPVPVSVLEQKTVGATLGEDSIRRSLVAGLVGILLVSIFMIFNYGKLGLLADIALTFYGLFVLAIFKLIPVTITLPGIAGIVLSVGMAVDANILIFERIREEIDWGKPFNLALRLGFERAWPSIRDSNISSLITSAILFYLGSGLVKGFALTLSIGVLVSMFTAILVTRNLVEVFYKKHT